MTVLNIVSTALSPASSGTYNFSVVRDDIIRMAMLSIGKLGEAESPTGQEVTDCALLLNAMVKQWKGQGDFARGLKMWTRTRGALFLSTTQHKYQLGPGGDRWASSYVQAQLAQSIAANSVNWPLTSVTGMVPGDNIGVVTASDLFWTTIQSINQGTKTVTVAAGPAAGVAASAYVFDYAPANQGLRPEVVVTALLRDINNNDTPLNMMTLQTYEALPTKTMTSFQADPTAIYYESQLGAGVLYTDCGGAQDVTKHLHIVYLRTVQDFDNPIDAPDYPQHWYAALFWGLAKQIAPMFNAPWTKEMEDNFGTALKMAQEPDAETTEMYFQPNAGNYYDP